MDEQSFLIRALGEVADALNGAGVNYALAGGLAFSALVEPRATVDIDLLILEEADGASDAGKDALVSALTPLFDSLASHLQPMVFAKATIWRLVGIQGGRELIIDFLMGGSEFHRATLQRKFVVDFHGHRIPLVTLEDLYLLKRLADRPQDRVDIAAIEDKCASELDRTYLDGWLSRWATP